jgi:hypothetical protein
MTDAAVNLSEFEIQDEHGVNMDSSDDYEGCVSSAAESDSISTTHAGGEQDVVMGIACEHPSDCSMATDEKHAAAATQCHHEFKWDGAELKLVVGGEALATLIWLDPDSPPGGGMRIANMLSKRVTLHFQHTSSRNLQFDIRFGKEVIYLSRYCKDNFTYRFNKSE